MNFKKCFLCKEEKSLDNFTKDNDKKDGLDYLCRKCRSIKNKERYLLNCEKINLYSKKWQKNNSQKIKIYRKRWNDNNQEYNRNYCKK